MVSSPRVITHVVDQAHREGAELISCFVISNRVPESVSSWLIYIGFMGDKPSGDVKSTISENYHQRAKTQLEEIHEAARQRGVACRCLLVEGDMVEEGIQIAQEEHVDLVLLNEPERSDFFRLIFGPLKESLAERIQCPVKVVEEVFNE